MVFGYLFGFGLRLFKFWIFEFKDFSFMILVFTNFHSELIQIIASSVQVHIIGLNYF